MTLERKVTIVVADDSPQLLELLAVILGQGAARVVTARDGQEAWEAIRTHRPSVAVLDADMPRLGGLEVASLVRETPGLAATRVLVVTGHTNAEAHAVAAGAHAYLAKPFRPRELLDAVRALAGG